MIGKVWTVGNNGNKSELNAVRNLKKKQIGGVEV
jgi:hypothetical protein